PAAPARLGPTGFRRVWETWLPAALVVLGIGLRVRQYLARRSLWNDEAALALNVVRRSYRGLLKPLDIEQGAPLGFLWAQRTAVNVLGNNELSLRLVPLLSGIAGLVLFAVLARRLLSPWAVAPAVLLFATLGPLVYYSAEAKQYSVDVAVTVLLVYATVRLLDGRVSVRRAVAWGAVGCASMLVSHPSVFVLAACSLVACVVLAVREGPRALAAFAPAVALWVAELAVLYAVSLRHLRANPALEAFWKEGYAPEPLRLGTAVPWVGRVVAGLVPNPVELSAPVLVLVLVAVGTGVLLARRLPAGLLVIAVAAAALSAGLLGMYPLKWRLALYLVPVVLLALAASVDAAPGGGGPTAVVVRVLALAALAAVAVHPVREAADVAVHPYQVTEARTVLAHVKAGARPGDVVYVHWAGAVLYDYYAPVLGLPARAGYFRVERAADCSSDPVAALRGARRVWAVFAFPPVYDAAESAETSLTELDRLGRRVESWTAPGNTRAVLYETTATPDPGGRPPGSGACLSVVPDPQ
ncbi:MAG: glycosyltransferase family 39 protein, partial [Actinomycetota bacterium]|nr:glycosyltransferase family 39 protein [Actinomycetota bacterium]